MSARASLALVVLGVPLAAACGDTYADTFQTGGAAQATAAPTGSFFDAGAVLPDDAIVACPDRRPDENAPCTVAGAACEYGASPDPACNATLACTSTETGALAWTRRPQAASVCAAAQCPSGAVASLNGQPCDLPSVDGGAPSDVDELVCTMDDGTCACTTGPDAAHAHARAWVCTVPRAPCPTRRPLAGEPCSDRLSCDYGSCDWKRGVKMECDSVVWLTGGGSCE